MLLNYFLFFFNKMDINKIKLLFEAEDKLDDRINCEYGDIIYNIDKVLLDEFKILDLRRNEQPDYNYLEYLKPIIAIYKPKIKIEKNEIFLSKFISNYKIEKIYNIDKNDYSLYYKLLVKNNRYINLQVSNVNLEYDNFMMTNSESIKTINDVYDKISKYFLVENGNFIDMLYIYVFNY